MNTKSYKPLIIFSIAVWTAVFILVGCLIFAFRDKPKSYVSDVVSGPVEFQQPVYIDDYVYQQRTTLLERSIAICKNEYATRIAHAVLAEHNRQGIPVPVAYALIGTECDKTKTDLITLEKSGYFNPKATSHKNCRGATQVCYETLCDFNQFNKYGHTYTWDDMYNIEKNIEVGVWHYMRYVKYVGEDWTNLYIIYNTGYGNFTKENNYWIYNDYTCKWETHDAGWYYRNNKYPPNDINLCFNDLKGFAPTRRFTIYLEMYSELFI